jgi:AraC-like DNA-binding protein
LQILTAGKYFGIPYKKISTENLIFTDNEYVQEKVDWHYHENLYFTFILKGRLTECSKKDSFNCSQDTLLIHNRQEAHYNIKPPGYTRGFQVEIKDRWFLSNNISSSVPKGCYEIKHPEIISKFRKIYYESALNDDLSLLSAEALLIEIFSGLNNKDQVRKVPEWFKTLDEYIKDNFSSVISLNKLSDITGVHPVHISRSFSAVTGMTFGDYIRKIRISNSVSLIKQGISLTNISHTTGFTDQSHFIRTFKKFTGFTPSAYKKLLKSIS